MRKALEGERGREGAGRCAADISADEPQPGLGGGAAGPMGEVRQPFSVHFGTKQQRQESVGGGGAGRGKVAEVTVHELGSGAGAGTGQVEVPSEQDGVDGAGAMGASAGRRQDRAVAARSFGEGWAGGAESHHDPTDDFFFREPCDAAFRLWREGAHRFRGWPRPGPVSTTRGWRG